MLLVIRMWTRISTVPGYRATQATGVKIFEKILSSDFDKCIPFAFYLDVMNAAYPSLILPSAVTFTTLCLVLMLE